MLAACSGTEAPNEALAVAPSPRGEVDVWTVAPGIAPLACGAELATDQHGVLTLDTLTGPRVLSERIAEPATVSDDGRLVVWTDDGTSPGSTALRVAQCTAATWSSTRTLVDDRGTPNRIAIAPDADRIAYVSSRHGIASVWIVRVDTGEAVQLTNRTVQRRPGAAPKDFVPVPSREPPRFEGPRIVWRAPDGEHSAVLP